MGRNLLIVVMVLCLIGLTGSIKADYTITNMDPVYFYLFDSPKDLDTSVTLTGNFLSWPIGSTLQYSVDYETWGNWPTTSAVTIDTPNGFEKIYFKVINPGDTSADVTFLGSGDPYPYFQTANIVWALESNKLQFSTATANNLDRISFIPLPASVLLLGSGLLGLALLGWRRKRS